MKAKSSLRRYLTIIWGGGAKCLLSIFALFCMAHASNAATYYWKGVTDDTAGGNWSELSNWSTESATGADATALPGSSDKFYGLQSRSIDLEGQEWSIGGWNSTGDWNRYKMYLSNGTLNVVGNVTTHSDDIYINNGATLVFASGTTFNPAEGDAGNHRQYVRSGGEVDVLGTLLIYYYTLYVQSGGTAVINPTSLKISSTAQKSFFQNDGGVLSLPSGLVFQQGSSSTGFSFSLYQNSGTLILGGPLNKNGKPGTYNATLSGGTIRVTGDVSFDFDSVSIPDNASITLDIDSGASINLSGVSFGAGAVVAKMGAGDFAFTSGMALPDTFTVAEGSLALTSAGSYDIFDVSFASGGSVKIGAAGVTLTGWDSTLLTAGAFVSGIASPVNGSTILTCANADVLARAKTGLDATLPEGFETVIDGNALKVTSSYVFNSTTITDLNDPDGWASGSVPVGKVVTIAGSGVNAIATSLPVFAGITVQDGASLTISGDATLPATTLADGASLTISSGSATVGGALTIEASASSLASVSVASGATLNVPGGTAFKNCSLALNGTLAATSDGKLIFGTANDGETAHFSMTANGATITALNSAGTENGSRLDFAVPASGGTVVVDAPIILKDTAITYNSKDGMAFGLNNPNAQSFQVIADNTPLDIGANTYVAGGANLVLTNNTVLLRRRHSAGDTGDSYYNIYVQNLGKITLVDGGEIRAGITRVNSDTTNGVIEVNPDEAGWVGIEVLSGGIGCWYKLNGKNKGTVQFSDGVMECFTTQWWGWGNRTHPFNNLAAVDIPAGKTMTFRGVAPKMSANNSTMRGMEFEAPFTGGGNLVVENTRSGTTMEPTLYRADNTCTGRLSVSPDSGTAKTLLHFADGAVWPGTVVFSERTDFIPVDENHSGTAANPATVTFGGLEMTAPLTFRVWITSADEGATFAITNDTVNVGATGWSWGESVGVAFDIRSSYTFDDLASGTEFALGTMPKGGAVPASSNNKVVLVEKAIDGDDATSLLVARIAASEFFFEGTGGVTDLNDNSGWISGSVPTGQDVMIRGSGVTAVVNADQTLPNFSSITLREGATLKVVGKGAEDAAIVLPSLIIDAYSTLEIGDEFQTETLATLPASLTTSALSEGANLSRIVIQTNATLNVGGGRQFKNVDFRLYGTVANELSEAAPVFGYAEIGETSYIAFTADGGVFGFHSNQNAGNGAVKIVYPVSGGTVVPVGTIILRNAQRSVNSWADFGDWSFGVNNPTSVPFDVLVDGTHLDCASYLHVSGAAHLSLVNGARIRRANGCLGHYFSMYVSGAAAIYVNDGCFVDLTTGDGAFHIENPTAVDSVVVTNGGIYAVTYGYSGSSTGHGVFVSDGGILGVGKLYNSCLTRPDTLLGFGSARLDGDLAIASVNVGTGDTNWDRHVKMANIPFTGTGDVTITNGVPAYPFTVTMQNGANTATGSIKVAKVEGDAETALYFANGANWAGTVVAGNVALTNLTDGAAAATATFGSLDLAADFPIRVWKSEGVYSADAINVGSFINNGGKISPVMMSEGEEFARGDSFVVGKVAKGATLPAVATGWAVKARPIDGDDANDEIVLKSGVGFQIIIR